MHEIGVMARTGRRHLRLVTAAHHDGGARLEKTFGDPRPTPRPPPVTKTTAPEKSRDSLGCSRWVGTQRMDLTWSEADKAFRAEARSWLQANVPQPALRRVDTAEGFALHLEWEHRLYEDRWSWSRGRNGTGAATPPCGSG